MKNEENKTQKGFEAYEDARVEKENTEVKKANDASVEAAINIINPDENTVDRG